MSELPVIDFAPFLDPASFKDVKRATAQKVHEACRDVGFFYLSNHGVATELMDKMLKDASSFFATATEDEKKAITIKKSGDGIGDDARGYQYVEGRGKGSHQVCTETLFHVSIHPNARQAVDMYRPVESSGPPYTTGMGINQWPSTPATFQSTSDAYVSKILKLAQSVLEALSLALGVDR